CLWKRNHVPDARCAAQNRVEPIESKRNPAMRWRAVTKGFEHITEARLDHLGRNLQHLFENRLLHVRLMDSNRPAAEFDAIHDHVIMLTAHLLRIAGEKLHVLRHRRGEGMMAR